MPAYKYFTKDGKTKWYANFYYEDWLGKRQHKCKRGFSTKKDAVEWERDFLAQGAKDPDILFSALIKNYMQDCSSRLKLTTLENKQYLIDMKLLPFFKDMKIGDITPIVIHRWQDAMINYRDEKGNPYSQTYLKTINNQLKEGKTAKIGIEGNFDNEVIMSINPDLILISPFKRGGYETMKDIGIPLIPHLGKK